MLRLALSLCLLMGACATTHATTPQAPTLAHDVARDGAHRDMATCEAIADASPLPQESYDRCLASLGY